MSPRAVDKRARPGNEGGPATVEPTAGPAVDLTAIGHVDESPKAEQVAEDSAAVEAKSS